MHPCEQYGGVLRDVAYCMNCSFTICLLAWTELLGAVSYTPQLPGYILACSVALNCFPAFPDSIWKWFLQCTTVALTNWVKSPLIVSLQVYSE